MAGIAKGRSLTRAVASAQRLTGMALAHAARVGAREIVLYEPVFRQELLQL